MARKKRTIKRKIKVISHDRAGNYSGRKHSYRATAVNSNRRAYTMYFDSLGDAVHYAKPNKRIGTIAGTLSKLNSKTKRFRHVKKWGW